jgi:hypothetical protein
MPSCSPRKDGERQVLPARIDHDTPAEDIDARLKKALDDLARNIGRSAVTHLKEMYPAALASVTKNAEISLTNHVRNNINLHMKPVLALLIELKKNGTI